MKFLFTTASHALIVGKQIGHARRRARDRMWWTPARVQARGRRIDPARG
jgi:hypothetical protein